MNIRRELEARLSRALAEVAGLADCPAVVTPSSRAQFGDYQASGAMAAAKAAKVNPRALAEKVAAAADLSDLAEPLEVAGPGFLNIRLKTAWLAESLQARAADERLGVEPAKPPRTIVVDYSAPNLAKEMHVGHLRSTIIGDALARTLEFLGHRVVRHNHVGDWGTQFGMLIACLKRQVPAWRSQGLHIADLEDFYRQAKALFDADAAFADQARAEVVALQQGNPDSREAWRHFIAESMHHCRAVYDRLGVTLADADIRGESAYNDDLPAVVADLRAAGLLTESQGAQCVFLEQFRGKDGQPLPLIIQKADEGYLYATTDLAAIRYRAGALGADRVLYVVDSRQGLHFAQVFAVAHAAGFDRTRGPGDGCAALEHVAFGTMLGADGRPFKTRAGGTIKLMDLLEEAQHRARQVVLAKNPELASQPGQRPPASRADDVAAVVGVGALKYADLSQNRTSDYAFSFEKMLSLQGNTAPYMQYAYARIRSIFRKGGLEGASAGGGIRLDAPAERALAVRLVQLPEILEALARECLPHLLCGYLWDLAVAFTGFYETCPVLTADEPTRASRLALCDLTARTIARGLGLLGIGTVEAM